MRPMSKLRPTIAVSSYDRTWPLLDGRVKVDGCDPIWEMELPIETMFHRALDQAAFDVSELSFSNFLRLTATGDCPYLGSPPIFPSRSFRHGVWFVRQGAKIRTPQDLRGLTIGVREFSMTAAVVARGMLSDELGSKPRISTGWSETSKKRNETRYRSLRCRRQSRSRRPQKTPFWSTCLSTDKLIVCSLTSHRNYSRAATQNPEAVRRLCRDREGIR